MEEGSARGAIKRPRQGDAAAAAAGEPRYPPYVPIADALKHCGAKVYLFAAVAEIGAALKSNGGTDFYVTLRIADKSREEGISVTFFANNPAQLPRVKSTGVVISLHDVKIKEHGDHFYVLYSKDLSSFALFESNVSVGCHPYQESMKYHGSEHDKELLTQMRTWLVGLKKNSLGLKKQEFQLMNLKSESPFDIVCKVLHVLRHDGKWIFYVWDGTDTPAAEFQTISDAEEVTSPLESPPLLEGPPLSRKVLCEMPCVGSVLQISSPKYFDKIRLMQEGSYWARFWNITCKQESGLWKGELSNTSGVRLLSDEDGGVVDRLKMFVSRNAKKVPRQPMGIFPSNVTDVDVDFKKGRHSTLRESLAYEKVTHVVKTLVRVVGTYPSRPSEVRSLSTGDCCIQLTLEDPTARIRAFVSTDELVKFFGGPLTEEVVMKKMNKVLGVPEAEDSEEVAPLTRNPPWIWCCLKSYYVHENDRWGSRTYQIFATTIRD